MKTNIRVSVDTSRLYHELVVRFNQQKKQVYNKKATAIERAMAIGACRALLDTRAWILTHTKV